MSPKAENKEKSAIAIPNLDKTDLAILRILQSNARATVKEIAEQVHLSTTPVHERIKYLEQTGVIKQYATLVDHAKVKKGLMVQAGLRAENTHSRGHSTGFQKNGSMYSSYDSL